MIRRFDQVHWALSGSFGES